MKLKSLAKVLELLIISQLHNESFFFVRYTLRPPFVDSNTLKKKKKKMGHREDATCTQ